MPTQHKCSFCGREFTHGSGNLYVKKDGSLFWFCSRRCRVHMIEHGTDARKLKWTRYFGMERRR